MKSISEKLLFIIFLLVFSISNSQQLIAEGGEYQFPKNDTNCVNDEQRLAIKTLLLNNISQLKRESKLINTQQRGTVGSFIWPVQQASGFDYNDVWSISNYVDHNTAFPNQITDYNCGTRSYDTTGGYNHQGIDIFTWPFTWKMVDDDQAEIIAAEAGQIIAKIDGNYDRNCTFNSDSWNAVYILHIDGSVGWYGHMKNGSLTAKNIGDTVTQGEFLGVIGSSGNSTGPHLHFEVYETQTLTQLIDPYAGSCNSLNPTTWWQSQKPYLNTNINAILTHDAPPVFNPCPTTEIPNDSNSFNNGDTVYFAAYLRDQIAGTSMNLQIIQPNDVPYQNWNFTLNDNYYASYWYWSISIPSDGLWKWQVTYNGQTEVHEFTVGTLGIENIEKDKISVYPNPFNDIISINSNTSIGKITLHDILGKVINTYNNIIEKDKSINTSELSKGIYFLTIESETSKKKTIKLIKK